MKPNISKSNEKCETKGEGYIACECEEAWE